MKATAIVQARMGSTRLPGKILMDIQGKPVLRHVVDRAKTCAGVDRVIVATTHQPSDRPVVQFCEESGIDCFQGSEDDVLDRYFQAAKKFDAGTIVRITADCPLLDPAIADRLISLHFSQKADYTSNTLHPTFPDGLDAEVFSFEILEKTWTLASLKSDREHVTPYIKNRPSDFQICELKNDTDLSAKRWTLDYPQDLDFIKILFSNLYPINPLFGMKEALAFLNAHPEVEQINRGIARNEGYAKSLLADKEFQK